MANLVVSDLASVGLVEDVDPTLLPPAAWTELRNARFSNGMVEKFLGHVTVGTPTVSPYWLVPVELATVPYWVYFGLDKAYSFDGTTHTNITPQALGADVDFTGTQANIWTGGVLNGVLVATNGYDPPVQWTTTKLTYLDWDAADTWEDKGYTIGTLRPYRNFLVGLDFNDGVSRYPHTVYWSNAADPLTVPSDWDYADPANDAGQTTLASTSGYLLDAEPLRDALIVYKEDAIHLMEYVGGKFVMQFKEISRTTGMLAKRCVKEFFGRHLVFGNDDIFVHDGQNIESIASNKIRNSIFNAIDPTYYYKSFVARNLGRSEMWVCFPETGETECNRAAIWNWKTNTWSHRDLPSPRHVGYGITFPTSDDETWNDDTAAWDTDPTLWSQRAYNPSAQVLVAAVDGALYQVDQTTQFDGDDITSYAVREGIILGDLQTVKMVRAIYPRATGGAMQVSVGWQLDHSDPIAWEGPYTFTPGAASKVDCRATGRIHSVKFAFPGGTAGALQGYDIEYVVVGGR